MPLDAATDSLMTEGMMRALYEQYSNEFFDILNEDLETVNSHFKTVMQDIRELERTIQQANTQLCSLSSDNGDVHADSASSSSSQSASPSTEISAHREYLRQLYEKLNSQYDLIHEFAQLNYLAFVKILKKHDKQTKQYKLGPYIAKLNKQPFYRLIDRNVPYTQPIGPDFRLRAFVASGDVDAVQLELSTGAAADCVDRFGSTPLHLAARHGSVDVVHALVKARADVNRQDKYGTTALHDASRAGHGEVIKALILAGAKIDVVDERGNTPLMSACESRSIEAINGLLKAGANTQIANNDGNTVLMIAAGAGASAAVNLLLEAKADQQARNRNYETALSRATSAGHTETVRTLLEYARATGTFAPIETLPEEDGKLPTSSIPLVSACVRGNVDCLELLLEACKEQRIRRNLARGRGHTIANFVELDVRDVFGCTPLLRAAEYQQLGCMRALLKAGANPNLACSVGDANTPIITCAVAGFTEGVRVLIEHKADLDKTGAENSTALMWAADRGHDEIVRLLLEAKASVLPRNMYGQTALIRACVWNNNRWLPQNTRTVELLLKAGVDCNVQTHNGSTALSIATIRGHVECVKLLLEHNARVDISDSDGCQPLIRAAMWGHVECIKLLLAYGANPDAQDLDGRTALMFAASGGHYEATELLLQAGANDELQGADGCTAFDYAMELGQTAIRALLLRHRAEKETASAVAAAKSAKTPAPEDAAPGSATEAVTSPRSVDGSPQLSLVSVDASSHHSNLSMSTPSHISIMPGPNIHAAIPAEEMNPDDPLAKAHAAAQAAQQRAAQAIASLLRRSTADTSRLREAAIKDHVDLIRTELERGEGRPGFIDSQGVARPWTDLPDRFGSTAVLLAARENSVESLRLLLSTNPPPNVNVRNAFGTTPLLAAATHGHSECVELLLHAGASLYARDSLGTNALIMACTNGHVKTVGILLRWNKMLSKRRSRVLGGDVVKKTSPEGSVPAPHEAEELSATPESARVEANDVITPAPIAASDAITQVSGTISDLSEAEEGAASIYMADAAETATNIHVSECPSERETTEPAIVTTKVSRTISNALPPKGPSVVVSRSTAQVNAGLDEEEADLTSHFGQRPSSASPSHSPLGLTDAALPPLVELPPGANSGERAHSKPSTKRTAVAATIKPKVYELFPSSDQAGWDFINGRNHAGLTPLIAAAIGDHADCVEKLIEGGAYVDEPDAQGDTALTHAARAGHNLTVSVLMTKGHAHPDGAQPRVRSHDGGVVTSTKPSVSPPLVSAARGGHTKILSLLLAHRAALEVRDIYGGTALIRASEHGHLACVRKLLAAKADVDALGEGGCTALALASHQGHAPVVQELIAAKASLDMRGESGATALLFAADKGHADCVKLLLDAKAHPEIPNVHRHTPLIRTVYWTNNEWRNEDAMRLLLEAKANVNAAGEHGNTALHVAAFRGHQVAIRMLLAAKADVDLMNNEGLTALSRAAAWGNLRCMITLLDHGANPHLQDKLGRTAMYHAASLGRLEAVQALLQRGANPSIAAFDGQTPYDVAVAKGYTQVAAHLSSVRQAEVAERRKQTTTPGVSQTPKPNKSGKGTASAPTTPNTEPRQGQLDSVPPILGLGDLHPPQMLVQGQVPIYSNASPMPMIVPTPGYAYQPTSTPGAPAGWTLVPNTYLQAYHTATPTVTSVPLPVARPHRSQTQQSASQSTDGVQPQGTAQQPPLPTHPHTGSSSVGPQFMSGHPSPGAARLGRQVSPKSRVSPPLPANSVSPATMAAIPTTTLPSSASAAMGVVALQPSSNRSVAMVTPVPPTSPLSASTSVGPTPHPKLTLAQLCTALRAEEALESLRAQGFATIADLAALRGEADWALVVEKLRLRRVLQQWVEANAHIVSQLTHIE